MKPEPVLELDDLAVIAENAAYRFAVGRVGRRWLGGAVSVARVEGERMLFVFPNVAEGDRLGLRDRVRAVRLTAAIAQDPESGYGGVTRWHVAPDLRGRPDEFRCPDCGMVGCAGRCSEEDPGDGCP